MRTVPLAILEQPRKSFYFAMLTALSTTLLSGKVLFVCLGFVF